MILVTHSFLNNDIIYTAGGVPAPNKNAFLTNFIKNHKYTIEEKIVNLCDLMCTSIGNVFTINKRLIDLIIRKNAHPNTQIATTKLYKKISKYILN